MISEIKCNTGSGKTLKKWQWLTPVKSRFGNEVIKSHESLLNSLANECSISAEKQLAICVFFCRK